MRILKEHEWFDIGGLDDPSRTLKQRDAEPTTHREVSVLASGNCPSCGSTLSGENGKFCVTDQIYWKLSIYGRSAT